MGAVGVVGACSIKLTYLVAYGSTASFTMGLHYLVQGSVDP